MMIRLTVEGHRQRKLEYDRNRKFKEGYRERDADRKRKKYWETVQQTLSRLPKAKDLQNEQVG